MESLVPILTEFLGTSRPAVTGIGVASLASKATLVEVEQATKLTLAALEAGAQTREGEKKILKTCLHRSDGKCGSHN